jgi:hypothetical protein
MIGKSILIAYPDRLGSLSEALAYLGNLPSCRLHPLPAIQKPCVRGIVSQEYWGSQAPQASRQKPWAFPSLHTIKQKIASHFQHHKTGVIFIPLNSSYTQKF